MNAKFKEILILAAELVSSRTGDVNTEDGYFATVDDNLLIKLQMTIADAFDLDNDDVNISDINKIRNVVNFDLD